MGPCLGTSSGPCRAWPLADQPGLAPIVPAPLPPEAGHCLSWAGGGHLRASLQDASPSCPHWPFPSRCPLPPRCPSVPAPSTLSSPHLHRMGLNGVLKAGSGTQPLALVWGHFTFIKKNNHHHHVRCQISDLNKNSRTKESSFPD